MSEQIIGFIQYLVATILFFSALVALILGTRSLFKKPDISFKLQRVEFAFTNEYRDQNIALLLAHVENKRMWLSETAKKISGGVMYRAPTNNHSHIGLNAVAPLFWVGSFTHKIPVIEPLETESDIQNAIKKYLYDRKEVDIPQGRGEVLAVLYGIEHSNKLYLASDPAIEIPLPKATEGQWVMGGCFFRIELAGENMASTVSQGSSIFGDSWTNWSYPKKVSRIRTHNKIRNILLKIGIGRDIKVLESLNE